MKLQYTGRSRAPHASKAEIIISFLFGLSYLIRIDLIKLLTGYVELLVIFYIYTSFKYLKSEIYKIIHVSVKF